MPDDRPAKRLKVAAGDYIVMDPDGDLKLIVGQKEITFLVDARSLRRQSPVFKAMLFGSFREAVQGPDWTVPLPEDDPIAFELILNTIHGNLNRLPSKIEVADLYNMVVLANKYDMIECLATRARQWYAQHRNPHRLPDRSVETVCEAIQQLWILNEVEMDDLYWYRDGLQDCMSSLAFILQVDDHGNLVYPRPSVEDIPEAIRDDLPELVNDELLRSVEQERIDVVTKYLSHIQAKVDNMVTLAQLQVIEDESEPVCQTCQYTVLSRMIISLRGGQDNENPSTKSSLSLWPIPQPENFQWSIMDLQDCLKKIQSKMDVYSQCTHGKTQSHASTTKTKRRTKAAAAQATIPRLNAFSTWMSFRGVKSRYMRRKRVFK